MSRGRKRLREVKDATKALQPAETKAGGVKLFWKMPDGTRQELGVPRPEKPAVTIDLDGRTPVTPPEWFSDAGPLSSARDSGAGPDPHERRRHARDEPIPPGWEVCLDDPGRLHLMLRRIPPPPARPRGQRPGPLAPVFAARAYVAEVEAGRRTPRWDHDELLVLAGYARVSGPQRGIPLHEVLAMADPPPPPAMKPWEPGYFSCGGRYR